MLNADEQMDSVVLKKQSASIRALARTTGRSRNTVRRCLRESEVAATRKRAAKHAEKLDAFKIYIVGRLKAAVPDRIAATVIFREIQARGDVGSYSRAKQFVCSLVLPARYQVGSTKGLKRTVVEVIVICK